MAFAIPSGACCSGDGGTGGGGAEYDPNFISIQFAYGDASPVIIGEVPSGKEILEVQIFILTPFDGAGAALQVGIVGTPADLMASSENDPTSAGEYSVAPLIPYGSATNIILTITPGSGASAGAGIVLVTFQP